VVVMWGEVGWYGVPERPQRMGEMVCDDRSYTDLNPIQRLQYEQPQTRSLSEID
jgi:hypothetical protein